MVFIWLAETEKIVSSISYMLSGTSITITLQCLRTLLTIDKKSKGGRGCYVIMINLPKQSSEVSA